MTVVAVEPDEFVRCASDLYDDTVRPATNAFYALSTVLDGCRSMAGADPAGAAWASGYDAAVRSTTAGWQALATAIYRAVCLLDQCGRNHASAESASHPGGASADVGGSRFDPTFSVHLDPLPPAGGGSSSAPSGWSVIEHWVGYVWPGGHQDRLRAAGGAWDTAAHGLDDAAGATLMPCVDLAEQRSGEVDDALHTMWALAEHLRCLAGACRSLARSCRALAGHIDQMRSQVEHQLLDLAGQSVVIEGAGALLSVATGGGSEVAAQALEASRIEKIGLAVRAIVKTFLDLVDDIVDTLPSISEVADRVGSAVSRLANARIRIVEVADAPGLRVLAISRDERITSTAMTAGERAEAGLGEAAAKSTLPQVKLTWKQIEKKFKHAPALGVDAPKGRAGYEQFERRIHDFVNDPKTLRRVGKYRGENAILNYDPTTSEVLIQQADGEFWSAWKLTSRQLRLIEGGGELGLQ